MKRKLLFTAIAIIGFATATMAQLPGYVPSNGLIGYFGFNNSGNDAISSSIPSSNTAVSTTDRFGIANSAYQFNGSNIIKYTNTSHPLFNIGNTYQTFTMNFWVNPTNTGNAVILGAFGWGYSVSLTTNNNIQFTYISANSPATWTTLTSSSTVIPNNWQMITITRTGTTNSIYINGVLNSTLTSAPNILVYANFNCWFGADGQDNNGYLSGKLDDIGIWNRALTQQEITALYQGSNNNNLPAYVPSNGLQAAYMFNGNAYDLSGNGNNGTVNGATLTTDRYGNANTAYSFNGTNSFIDLGINSSINGILNDFTISYWVYKLNSNYGSVIASYSSQNGSNWRFHSFINNSSANTAFMNNSMTWQRDTTQNNSVYLNSWCNIIVIRNGGNISTYINSVLSSSSVCSLSPLTNPTSPYATTKIGYNFPSNSLWYFNGKIDDILIYNRALTQAEITTLYQGCNLSVSNPSNQNVNLGSNAQFITTTSNLSATYQWQTDLGLGFQNISNAGQYSGATNDTLIVSNTQLSNNNQQFRCIVNDGGCKDTSIVATLTIANIGINETNQNHFKVYPNPASSQINVEIIQSLIGSSFAITDQIGKTVLSGKLNAEKSTIEIGDLSGGIYLFSIGNNAKQTFKVIKK